jgi:hypothetical protein
MAGIIINIPTPQLINPTNQIMPVRDGNVFVDSNFKNVVDEKIESQNALDDQIGLQLDFVNNIYTIGDPLGLSIKLETGPLELSINGVILSNPIVTPDKMLKINHDGNQYFIQLYVEV